MTYELTKLLNELQTLVAAATRILEKYEKKLDADANR